MERIPTAATPMLQEIQLQTQILQQMQASTSAQQQLQMQLLQQVHTAVEGLTEVLQGVRTAVASHEVRCMHQHLSGAETSRRFSLLLADYSPHGPPNTWRQFHSERCIEELKANWSNACSWRKVRTCDRLWGMITEGCYQRAVEEQDPTEVNSHGETVRLQDKINFWRASIPAARGLTPAPNLVEAQRQLQLGWYAADGVLPPAVLQNDLCGWRQHDLQQWTLQNPGRSMSSP